MCCVTFFSDDEIKNFKVTDKDVLEWMGHVEKDTGTRLIIQEHTFFPPKNWWRKAPEPIKLYSLYFHIHTCEYQITNFAGNDFSNSSINQHVDKYEILNYMIGYLGGFAAQKTKAA